ncbi:MAG: DUF1887 family CARF protein [Lachnospiraceae bacterium]|nr:DUF1887 family CARF protein [Lachnospiraceae bacterium]
MTRVISKIQQLLLEYPLYEQCEEDGSIRILIVGENADATEFVDRCLAVGQMLRGRLQLTWQVTKAEVKNNYLSERPALSTFVSVDGDNKQNEYYASLVFLTNETSETSEYDYVFSSVGDEACVKGKNEWGKCGTSLISSPEELERMAFNVHHAWEGFGNIDTNKLKERFSEAYNYNASISFALSIPFKLRSVGICENDPFKAAERFKEIVDAAEKGEASAKKTIAELSYLEHRRWVIEMATKGVTDIQNKNGHPDYEACVERKSVKKKDNGKVVEHPCMVTSTAATPLTDGPFAVKGAWDDKKVSTAGLDSLDRMSVELHRVMRAAAQKVRRNRAAIADTLTGLKAMGGDNLYRKYIDRYRLCVENVLDYSKPHAVQYETYERELLNSLGCFNEANKQDIQEKVSFIKDEIYPLLECSLYRDYKAYDTELVSRMPYILTGEKEKHICVSLGEMSSFRYDNNVLFQSIASATALGADKLTFVFVYDKTTNLDVLKASLKGISNYFRHRAHSCKTDVEAFINVDKFGSVAKARLERTLQDAVKASQIVKFSLQECADDSELSELISKAVKASGADFYDGTVAPHSSGITAGRIVAKICETLPYFEFDTENRCVINTVNCNHLKYRPQEAFIQVEDMFALLNAQDKEFNYQDFYDSYMDFWRIYDGTDIGERDFAACARCWTKVCTTIAYGGLNNLRIAGVKPFGNKKNDKPNKEKELQEENDRRILTKMLRRLREMGILTELTIGEDFTVTARVRDVEAKEIFAKAGDLLEVYVYFEALKTGYFDDIQTGYRFCWEAEKVVNEMDCVLTKGFRSLLVECKSTQEPEEGFYLTLDSLGNHFGIGYKKVLIMVTNTRKESYGDYLARGQQMDVITISSKGDLGKIGKKLAELIG